MSDKFSGLDRLAALSRRPHDDSRNTIPSRPAPSYPKPLAEDAFYGIAGEFVRGISPHTESDDVALLVPFLAVFGNVIGRRAYFPVEADRHYTNLNVVLVGGTAKARKGTSWGYNRELFGRVDPEWKRDRLKSGLSSGEGLTFAVRDPIEKAEPIKDRPGEFKQVITDPGVTDKRLFDLESEFSGVLKNFKRDGNKLSAVIRDAWDRGDMGSLTKNEAVKATNAHISILGHITQEELSHDLSATEMANGFGNRFLWFSVSRSKRLPFGGRADAVEATFTRIESKLRDAVRFGQTAGRVWFDEDAARAWETYYNELSEDRPGILGQITARDAPQIIRLALIYAVLDQSTVVGSRHLNAALAIWGYSVDSCRYIFGDATGDAGADRILDALCAAPDGLTQTQISEGVFDRNRPAGQIAESLRLLEKHALVRKEDGLGDQGRAVTRWFAASSAPTKYEFNELNPTESVTLSSLNSYQAQPEGAQS